MAVAVVAAAAVGFGYIYYSHVISTLVGPKLTLVLFPFAFVVAAHIGYRCFDWINEVVFLGLKIVAAAAAAAVAVVALTHTVLAPRRIRPCSHPAAIKIEENR